ncbi:hypothetical protein SAMN05216196_101342 [Lutimaribacter pacificus]|uniref:Uncharacterized protein n=1 Tax=Lutimaribacter pacificus TaxID=391948 RepID=A0A1H0AY82_9RHOB|nr:hypothetical protein [Lutimaribacter pacificus]SDN37993.1 hypothetical protein SAMN05216196_101342 [Lutimaribacter pacificus]SHJ63550.1 hypothetical protein SAMN05444142_101875 [Lutimaribacter pacificus]
MVKDPRLVPMIEELEQAAMACAPEAREEVRKRLHSMIAQLRAEGHPVPQRLRDVDEMLTDASVEDRFDNMPL